MSKTYGKGTYGTGNYSALTATTLTAAQGSFTETGNAALFPLAAKLTAAVCSFVLTGFAAGINGLSWAVSTGFYTLTGIAVDFTSGNLWTPETDDTATWTPQSPGSDPWTAVTADTATWTPQPTSE